MDIKVGVSGRHVHLCRKDLEILFGKGFELEPERYLSIPTQYICRQRLTVKSPKRQIDNVAVIGPLREYTQVEMSKTDCVKLGVNVPIKLSGNLEGSASVELIGPEGRLLLEKGLIVAMRHIHMTTEDAENLGFSHKDYAMLVVRGKRSLVFDYVVVRVAGENTHSELHLDTDEANTADLKTGDEVELLHIDDKKIRLEQLINMLDERQLRVLEDSVRRIITDEKERVGRMEDILKVLRR